MPKGREAGLEGSLTYRPQSALAKGSGAWTQPEYHGGLQGAVMGGREAAAMMVALSRSPGLEWDPEVLTTQNTLTTSISPHRPMLLPAFSGQQDQVTWTKLWIT